MDLNYKHKCYDNFEQLKEEKPKLAALLLREYDEGDWMNEELYVYPTIQDYARYSLHDGVYMNFTYHLDDELNASSIPNFLDYLDFKKLGDVLLDKYCGRYIFETKSGILVESVCGFRL